MVVKFMGICYNDKKFGKQGMIMELQWILQPVLGAVIGCFTNYIAIKMLFWPFREIRLFGWKLPFTPGMIPKRRKDIARAVGQVISNHLLEKDDIIKVLTDDSTVEAIRTGILNYRVNVPATEESESSVGSMVADIVLKMNVKNVVTQQIMNYVQTKMAGNFIGKFIGKNMIQEISEQIGEWVESYLQKEGREVIQNAINQEIAEMADMPVSDILAKYGVELEQAERVIDNKYREIVGANCEQILNHINIADMVEEKINAMDIEEMEKLLLQLMKKELNAIVYLGALIGFVLGMLGLLF